jgi:hypothetical protein
MKLADPIAQSFYVQPETGYFATAVDLFFYSKDPTLPVTIQLRPTRYNQPSDTFYQYSEVVLTPDKISTSNDGTLATRVTFESPIFLDGENFHCICLLTNSDQYKVHISRLSEMDLASSNTSSVFVTRQPLSGSFFKSQNGSLWTEVQTDDLKFTLYRANFKASQGDINFYNAELGEANNQIATLEPNPIENSSRQIRVGFGSTLIAPSLTLGNLITQVNATGVGNLINYTGSSSGNLNIINAGIGYTPLSGIFTFSNVPLKTISGSGRNATATITISNGSVISSGTTINSGGVGYSIGDVLTPISLGTANLGSDMLLSIQTLTGINELFIGNVQGEFEINNSNKNILAAGADLNFSPSVKAYPNGIVVETSGDHLKINHKNHGMHSNASVVRISNVISDVNTTKLTSTYSNTSTSNIIPQNAANFSTFENITVSATNPGYVLIGSEIIAYTGVSGNTLTGVTRSIDQTIASSYSADETVMKYELNGVSLRRINKTHILSATTESDAIGLDYYKIKIDFTQAGNLQALPQGITNRSSGSTLGQLFFKETESNGGNSVKATQNIPFEIIRPIVEAKVYPTTKLTSQLRTVTGKSISGNEISYLDAGYSEINLTENNYFNSPRIVASKVNENSLLTNFPGNKSLTMKVQLNSSNSYVSPTIDLQRVALSFTTNRVNDVVSNFETDSRVATNENDPSAFIYVSELNQLDLPANGLKVYITAHINIFSEIRCLYSISNNPNDPLVYYPFPGYNNPNNDISKNTGLYDSNLLKEDKVGFKPNEISYKEYTFTANSLAPFRYYSIKLVGTSTNQAYPPRIDDLRVIALAGEN